MTLISDAFKSTKKGNKRAGQAAGARLGYDNTKTHQVLKAASHGLYLLLERKSLSLTAKDRDVLRAIVRKAEKLLKK